MFKNEDPKELLSHKKEKKMVILKFQKDKKQTKHKKQALCFQQQQNNRSCHGHNTNKRSLKHTIVCSKLDVIHLIQRAARGINIHVYEQQPKKREKEEKGNKS